MGGGANSSDEERVGTLFLNDVTRLDCAFFDPSWGVVGQSWHVDVAMSGELDENGFVYDFSLLKQLINQTMKETLDHALIIPVMSQSVHYSELPDGEHWTLTARGMASGAQSVWEYKCPKGAVYPIRCVALTPQAIEQEFARLLRHRLPETAHEIRVKLRAESVATTDAVYRYTHGIPGHHGLCQRPFHGHRSRIEVYVGDERRPDKEHYVMRELFANIVHIATPQQLKSPAPWEIGRRGPAGQSAVLTVKGSLGSYEATLPAEHVFLVEQETSIECIAASVARVVAKGSNGKERIKVVCYEGINKGGVAIV